MRSRLVCLTLSVALVSPPVLAGHGATDEPSPGPAQVHAAIQHVLDSNREFVASHAATYFKPFADRQTPLATVVSCSDSRVQTPSIDKHPDNDVFVIRNIGNQIDTAPGSVAYGIRHLHTPLLLIIGHSACGAIKAALGDYSAEPPTIKRELDGIHVPKGSEWVAGVITNVNNQVSTAMKEYAHEVEDGHLAVMGAVYDFRDDLKHAPGRLTVVNLNGETDAAKIAKSPLLEGIEGVIVGATP